MSYQNKATPEELQYMDVFRSRQPEILAYKQQHGGDLEGAFKAVTGVPWPDNRSVKMNDGQPEITADRTVKSVMGRYVIPIAAAALTGGAALGVGPLAGVFGGAASAAGGAGTAAGTAGAAGGAASAAGTAGTLGTLGTIASAVSKGKDIYGRILDAVPAATAGINQATQDAAANRGTKLSYEQEQERLRQNANNAFQQQLIAREVENRAATKDAMDRMQSASYNMQRKVFTPPTFTSNVAGVKPQTAVNFNIGRTSAPTADEMAAYTAQRDQSRDRLMSGPQLPPLTDPTQRPFYTQPNPNLNPGTMERIGQIAGPALSIWDRIQTGMRTPPVMRTQPVRG